ncbi:MAG TPA: DUF6152 family protein [Candidatus Acidoferrales bacterium]|jgi:hypothetical protein
MIKMIEMTKTIRNRLVMLLAVVALIATVPAYAHHGSAAYDAGKTVTKTGTVTAYKFVNPHVMISMDVKGPSGTVDNWEGEMTSPNHLERSGWTKNTIKIGDQITLAGVPSKSGSTTMIIHKVVKNGEEIPLTGE